MNIFDPSTRELAQIINNQAKRIVDLEQLVAFMKVASAVKLDPINQPFAYPAHQRIVQQVQAQREHDDDQAPNG